MDIDILVAIIITFLFTILTAVPIVFLCVASNIRNYDEEIYNEGYRKGYQKGYADGKAAGDDNE